MSRQTTVVAWPTAPSLVIAILVNLDKIVAMVMMMRKVNHIMDMDCVHHNEAFNKVPQRQGAK